MSTVSILAGDIALVRNGGRFGEAIRFADQVKAARLGLPKQPWNHAAVAISPDTLVEADAGSGGAITASIAAQHWGHVSWMRWYGLSAEQRDLVAAAAKGLVGTPYNFADIAALALDAFGISNKWVVNRQADTTQLVCSQLVDLAYQRANLRLFDDGRHSGQVTPGDLGRCPQLLPVTPIG